MGKEASPASPKLCDVSPQRVENEPDGALPLLVRRPSSALYTVLPSCQDETDRLRGLPSRQGSSAIAGGFPGQAVAGVWRFWRGRRLRGALAAVVVDAGLRPRFFSVLPTPANFRSR